MAAKLSVFLTWMNRSHMADVLRIEEDSFEFAWSEEDFIRCLRQRNCIGMVAEHATRAVGFMVYELHRDRLHLLNLAVDPAVRLRGVGEAMLDKLVGKLSPERRKRLIVQVREKNLDAQLFFKACGWRAICVARDFYDDRFPPEDAFVFQFHVRQLRAACPVEAT